jgi:hypothetical protein
MMKVIMTSVVAASLMIAASAQARVEVVLSDAGPDASGSAVGTASGSVPASNVLAGCQGYIASVDESDFDVILERPRPLLRIETQSTADLALLVQLPDGSYRRDDDSADDLQPRILINNPQPGTYRVWVAVYRPRTIADFTLLTSSEPVPEPLPE